METEKIRFCTNCGAKLTPGGKFCMSCGKRVEIEPAPSDIAAAEPEVVPASAETVSENTVPETGPVNTAADTSAAQVNDMTEPETSSVQTFEEPAEEPAAEAGSQPSGVIYGVPVDDGNRNFNSAGGNYTYSSRGTNYGGYNNADYSRYQYPQPDAAPQPAQKQTAAPAKKRFPGWAKALIIVGAVILSLLVFVFLVAAGSFSLSNFTGRIIDAIEEAGASTPRPSSGETGKTDNTQVGDKTVPSGSDVTINITGDAQILAASVYAKAKESVVGIAVYKSASETPWAESSNTIVTEASGVVYTADGYIITNCHVVSGALDENNKLQKGYQVRVYAGSTLGSYYDAAIVGVDYTSDLAVLKVNATDLVPAELESSSTVKIGDQIFVMGCPGGIEFMDSITGGIVGGLNKNIVTSSGYAYDLIQTDAAINPGNSGGALLNSNGKLIGICEMKIIEDGYEGMGFAIASDTAKEVCDKLIKDGKVVRPAIGITVNSSYDLINAGDAGLPAGAWISDVDKNSPAGKAGLESGMIITEFNGTAVYNFVSLRAEILKCEIGDEVTVKVYVFDSNNKANGTYKTFRLILQSLEDEHRDFD